jgi:CheY-like chemotaxis protein
MVTDTGPGIAPENLDRVFNAFDRLGAEATRVDGTGLGLTLSRQLIVAMGGAIGVESVAGRGSTFWVELPLGAPPDSPETKTAPGEQAESDPIRVGGSILYVEDNLANLKLMERVLTQQNGFHLLAAMQGRLGIELARDYRPQLILLDLHLPDMLGSEVLRELKTNPATANIPVVMITADASPGQAALFLDAGARAYLTKPLDLKEFLELTDSILREES